MYAQQHTARRRSISILNHQSIPISPATAASPAHLYNTTNSTVKTGFKSRLMLKQCLIGLFITTNLYWIYYSFFVISPPSTTITSTLDFSSNYIPIPKSTICDPFAEPGFLQYDTIVPLSTNWIPFSSSCPPSPNYLALLSKQDSTALSFLANRTILILGDSVDRNGIEHLAVMLGLPRYPVPYADFKQKGIVPTGWDERGIPWVVEVPWLDLTFTNGFLYGLDDEDNFREQPDWHAPGLAEDRIHQLIKVHTDQMKYPPSFISLHSGLWDLAFFGRQDRSRNLSSEITLTSERIEWWQSRMSKVIQEVKSVYSGVPIWYRKLHRVGPVGGASYDWRHSGSATSEGATAATFSNFFTDVRVHQIREMQEQVVTKEGIPSFDFGEVWEGFQNYQQMVHPLIFPGGPIYVNALLHHIYLESLGRENWSLGNGQERRLSPLTAGGDARLKQKILGGRFRAKKDN